MKRALCVGINDYPGDYMDLWGCVNDADDWAAVLQQEGFNTTCLYNENATKNRLLTSLRTMIANSEKDDVVVFTYSGHGTNVPDVSGDEFDGYDEALYVYDGILLDDELYEVFKVIPKGVHMVVICDSCFSGTITRAHVTNQAVRRYRPTHRVTGLKRNKSFMQKSTEMVEVVLTGCSDMEYSYDAWFDNRPNGALTYYAIKSLALGTFDNYSEWHTKIRKHLPAASYPQTPQLEGSEENKTHAVFRPYTSTVIEPEPSLWEQFLQWFRNFFLAKG